MLEAIEETSSASGRRTGTWQVLAAAVVVSIIGIFGVLSLSPRSDVAVETAVGAEPSSSDVSALPETSEGSNSPASSGSTAVLAGEPERVRSVDAAPSCEERAAIAGAIEGAT